MAVRVGIDTGGTFTDLVAVDEESGRWAVAKVPSNEDDPVGVISAALESVDVDIADVGFLVVGTTIGINAVLTRRGARVIYLTTQGFEDIPFIQRISRKYHYDFSWRKPEPMTLRPDCIGVPERLNEVGEVIEALDTDELIRLVGERTNGSEERTAVAVCYLFSYLNDVHEEASRAALAEALPDLPVSLSSDVAPIWREYERGTTTIVDAYLKPLIDDYVDGVSTAISGHTDAPWSLLKSNGGHALAEEARRRPSHLLLSGIAGGAIGGAYFAREMDAPRGIVLDMGGTSCDVCLIVDGEPLYGSDYEIEYGLPVSIPGVTTKTIGAGGGSIGWVDPGGFLQVGPQSAGADPGPACYARGGAEATITDANVLLGRLNPDYFLGGRIDLDADASTKALTALGTQLGLDPVETASSMVRVTNENMANAIRIVTVEEGIDPREFAIIAFGGAGPAHAAEIADSMGITRVLVPMSPGLCSAFGTVAAQVRVDAVKSVALVAERTTGAELATLFDELEQQASGDFARQGRSGSGVVRRLVAMRYQGQNYEQDVPVPDGPIDDGALAAIVEGYHQLHDEFYGHRFDGIPVELVRLTVVVADPEAELPSLQSQAEDRPATEAEREVFFPGHGFVQTTIVGRDDITEGSRPGPLIVESMDSTIVVPPEWTLSRGPTTTIELARTAEGGS